MADLADLISVVITTSPVAEDPDHMVHAVVKSVTDSFRPVLGQGYYPRLIIGADGVRPEQRALTDAYNERLKSYSGFDVLRLPAWGHQANVLRLLLAHVTTPLVLFLEHDTPLTPDVAIDWQTAAECILSRELDLIRFLHEAAPLAEHAHLFLDKTDRPQYFGTMPYLRTVQWSQRPHLAHTQWYRWLIETYYARSSRCFVEDAAYGIVMHHWNEYGMQGWEKFRLAVYSDPVPTFQRSYHLDGRGGEPKLGQVFACPGDTWPEGAPAPTLGRMFE